MLKCLSVLIASPNFTVGFYTLLCGFTTQPRSVLFLVFMCECGRWKLCGHAI